MSMQLFPFSHTTTPARVITHCDPSVRPSVTLRLTTREWSDLSLHLVAAHGNCN